MSARDRIAGVLTRHHAAGTWETADAIIAELHAGGIALVPTLPTIGMVVAAIERPDTSNHSDGLFYEAIYCAMVAAAQEPRR